MKGLVDRLCKCFAVSIIFILFALWCSTEAYADEPIYYDGWSDQFKVTVTWDTETDHQDEGNYFGVYYYMPANGCYYKADTGQYSFVEWKPKATKEKGTRTWTCYLQGPPCRINMSVYGSAMDHTQYYIRKVEVEPIHPLPGTGLPTKFTLWEGKFGCSVATMFTNTIACDLFLDRGKPEFSGWYDPYTNKEAVFGDDKVMETTSYYDKGCVAPYIYGKYSGYDYYDQYGVVWPSYPPYTSSPKVTAKSGRKVVIDWKNIRKKLKKVLTKTKCVEVQYSTNSKFKNATTINIETKALKKKTTIKYLKANKKYYFRVRLSDGKRPITNWSKKIKIRIKK